MSAYEPIGPIASAYIDQLKAEKATAERERDEYKKLHERASAESHNMYQVAGERRRERDAERETVKRLSDAIDAAVRNAAELERERDKAQADNVRVFLDNGVLERERDAERQRAEKAEYALVWMVKQYSHFGCFDQPHPWTYSHDFMHAGETAFEYLVNRGLARYTENGEDIVFVDDEQEGPFKGEEAQQP